MGVWLALAAATLVGALAGFWLARRPTLRSAVAPSASAVPGGATGLDDVVDVHPVGVVLADRDGTVEYRNAGATRLAGTHSGVLLDAAVERLLSTARRDGATSEVVEFFGPPLLVLDVAAQALPDGRAVAFVTDVTERRRAESMRTDFVANVSHELKTPIGALAVLAEALAGETDPTTVSRLVERMQAEADRANRTIDDLLELSRIERGEETARQWLQLGDVVRAAIARVTEPAVRSGVVIDDRQCGGAPQLYGDRRQLVSAIGNLVENAVKYSDSGGTVSIGVRADGDWVEIAVSDDGVGIPRRDLDRIFERFYRVDHARSRSTGGTGLGLSIVRHVASNHGGEVSVSSVEGAGSTFVLRLPRRLESRAEGAA